MVRRGLVLFVLALISAGCSLGPEARGPGDRASDEELPRDLSTLPLYFIENQGQLPAKVSHYVQGQDASLFFTDEGLTLSLEDDARRWAVELDFVGANETIPRGIDRTSAEFSYFTGNQDEWRTGLSTYGGLAYRDLWPGIDLVYRGDQSSLKYSLVVAPGADPGQIRMAYRGTTGVRLNDAGQLDVSTPAGGFLDRAPVSFQEIAGERVSVQTSFALDGSTFGFDLAGYDPRHALVIDPALLLYAGYIGGSSNESSFDTGGGIAVDGGGSAYVASTTQSAEGTFPDTAGPDTSHNGGQDAFVAKVNPAGTALVYAGYIGGASTDEGNAIAVDASGNAYVAGSTSSTEATFPDTGGPDTSHNGSQDAFVAKVNPAGTSLVYAGYIGGSNSDEGRGIGFDASGNAYVTGGTFSTEASFPDTGGPDTSHNGGQDAFVAKVNPAGTALVYAGYIGGSGDDAGRAIDTDGSGNAVVAGRTTSDQTTFPDVVGPDISHNGGFDAFVAKVNSAGTTLDYAGYVGGSSFDQAFGIALDGSGNAYLGGQTGSDQSSFPVVGGPDPTYNGGALDAFVTKVNATGTALVYSGYVGGSDDDAGRGAVAVDPTGAAYVSGWTRSTGSTFPDGDGFGTLESFDSSFNGGMGFLGDAYVAKVNPAGSALVYAGYIGGSGADGALGVAVDQGGNAYVLGGAESTEATFPDGDGFGSLPSVDNTHNGGFFDAFVAKIGTTETCEGQPATHLGSSGDDVIVGTGGPDVVLAGGGNDQVDTRAGDDLVCAGEGNDSISGGAGNDRGLGGLGNDRFRGQGGNDTYLAEEGNDKGAGGGGKDRFKGGGGKDRLGGAAKNDRLAGQNGNDRLLGGGGKDRLKGGRGKKDRCSGGAGTDRASRCEVESSIP